MRLPRKSKKVLLKPITDALNSSRYVNVGFKVEHLVSNTLNLFKSKHHVYRNCPLFMSLKEGNKGIQNEVDDVLGGSDKLQREPSAYVRHCLLKDLNLVHLIVVLAHMCFTC